MHLSKKNHIIVIGAGWAGLSAGVWLSNAGFQVTLLEAAPQIGGRARTVRMGGYELDNGQHFFIGAYRELLATLALIGVSEEEVFFRKPLHLRMLNFKGVPILDFNLSSLRGRVSGRGNPGLSKLWSILKISSLSWRHRFELLSFLYCLKGSVHPPVIPRLDRGIQKRAKHTCTPWTSGSRAFARDDTERLHLKKQSVQDTTVEAFLKQIRLSSYWVETLLAPLCQAALSTPIQMASAHVFCRVLKETFGGELHHSDGLFPKKLLSDCFPNPAKRFIEKAGGRVLLRERVLGFRKNEEGFSVFTETGTLKADGIILATHPKACLSLIEKEEKLVETAKQLKALRYQPITTLYFQYPPFQEAEENWDMLGLVGTTGQWLFNRRGVGQEGLISVVISGEGPHDRCSKTLLLDQVEQELKMIFPDWKVKPIKRWLVREKEAALCAAPHVSFNQPDATTALSGLWLAGDYTVKGYPGTLESAVRSGVISAQHVGRY